MLAPCARGTIDVNAQIGRIDVDFHGVIDFGVDEDAGERRVPARVGIERRLAHQAVHAGFRTQHAKGIRAADLDRCALDPGHFAVGLLEQFGLEVAALGVAQVHAFEHGSPVLGLGAAGTGLDVDEAVVRVKRIVEHALEFQVGNLARQRRDIRRDRLQGGVVVFLAGQFEQFLGIVDSGAKQAHARADVLEELLFAAEVLGTLGIIPDVRAFQLTGDYFQALLFGSDVKDTSAVRPASSGGRRAWRRSD